MGRPGRRAGSPPSPRSRPCRSCGRCSPTGRGSAPTSCCRTWRVRRRRRPGPAGAAALARAGGRRRHRGDGAVRLLAAGQGVPRPRSRPPTTTGGCWRRSATGTRSACAPRWGSRRHCGRRHGARARSPLRALTDPGDDAHDHRHRPLLLALGRPRRRSSRSRRGWPFVPLRLRSALMLGAGRAVRGADRDRGRCTATTSPPTTFRSPRRTPPGTPSARCCSGYRGRRGGRWASAASLAMARVAAPGADAPARSGRCCSASSALVPVAVVVAWRPRSRGLFGEISHAWQSLTEPQQRRPRHARTGSPSSAPAARCTGSRAWTSAATRCSRASASSATASRGCATPRAPLKTDQAHSYLVQTFADLGLIGVALTLALLVAWCRAAARPLARRPPLARS